MLEVVIDNRTLYLAHLCIHLTEAVGEAEGNTPLYTGIFRINSKSIADGPALPCRILRMNVVCAQRDSQFFVEKLFGYTDIVEYIAIILRLVASSPMIITSEEIHSPILRQGEHQA